MLRVGTLKKQNILKLENRRIWGGKKGSVRSGRATGADPESVRSFGDEKSGGGK